jgi:hypothetical protein
MRKGINIFLLILLVIFILSLCYSLYKNFSYNKELVEIKNDNNRLSNFIRTLNKEKDDLRNKINDFPALTSINIDRFKRKGMEDPENYIIKNLFDYRKIIPVEGTLGGTTDFYQSKTWILSKQWVYTEFSDGHFWGKMLLKYKFTNDNKIHWEILDYHLE